jgi:hypothetical protein
MQYLLTWPGKAKLQGGNKIKKYFLANLKRLGQTNPKVWWVILLNN